MLWSALLLPSAPGAPRPPPEALQGLAEGIGAHSFVVETVTRVGYRLRLTQGGSNRQLRNADCLLLRRDELLLDRCARSVRSSVSRGNTGTLAR